MKVPSRIPTRSRELVEKRDHGLCVRCHLPASDWHHRRTRHVKDEHTHSPANGVMMCRSCHGWVHDIGRAEAERMGWIVSRYVSDPSTVPVTHARWGRVLLTHEGKWVLAA